MSKTLQARIPVSASRKKAPKRALRALMALALASPALSHAADCPPVPSQAPNPVIFVNPANGARDVSRFPVISISFQNVISIQPADLAAGIRLLDRIGRPVPLRVIRSGAASNVAIASPESAADRLEPASDYFLEISLGTNDPSQVRRTHFMTGGLKSIFCIHRGTETEVDVCNTSTAVEVWKNSCDENYYRKSTTGDDVIITAINASCSAPPPVEFSDCSCQVGQETGLGGRIASCACAIESVFLNTESRNAAFAVVQEVSPLPGASLPAATLTAPVSVSVKLDSDIGSANAANYRLRIQDVTRGDLPPTTVFLTTPSYSTTPGPNYRSLFASASLQADRRYRAVLELAPGLVPQDFLDRQILSSQPFRYEWTFNTWSGPSGALTETLPSARTEGVSFPTHLPLQPHLRFLFNGPVPCGLGDLQGPPFIVRRYGNGPEALGFASWIDQDMSRVHLMGYEALQEGQRYEVFCSGAFASALGNPSWCQGTTAPIARFLTQVTPPADGTDDVRHGQLSSLKPANEAWLTVRPTVINYPHGFKERYATDAAGPTSFAGHVMIVPPTPAGVIGTIRVNPAAGCRELTLRPSNRCTNESYFITAATSCTSTSCDPGFSCTACPGQGSAACPDGESRCAYSHTQYQTALTAYCRAIIDGDGVNGPEAACSLEDAYRCVSGGTDGCLSFGKNRMNATSEAGCPSTHRLDPNKNCVSAGTIAINLAAGEHPAAFTAYSLDGKSWDPASSTFVTHPAPAVIQPDAGVPTADLTGTVPLPSAGLSIPSEPCQTPGKNNADQPYICPNGFGVCGPSTFDCIPADQGQEGHTIAATCGVDNSCPDGSVCNYGVCREKCGSDVECDPGYFCDNAGFNTGFCSRRRACATSADCFDGFECVADPADASRSVCVADADSPSFDVDGGGNWTSRWVQVDSAFNIWRLWWPQRATSSGSKRFDFTARIGSAAGGALQELPLLDHTIGDYETCDTSADPAACVLAECDRWNDLSYAGQLEDLLARLRDDGRFPPPYGFWGVGYQLLVGGAVSPAAACTLSNVGNINPVSFKYLDGPQSLFVKLPVGTSPANYRLEGTPKHDLGLITGAYDLTVRGLRFRGYDDGIGVFDTRTLTAVGNQFIRETRTTPGAIYSSDGNPVACTEDSQCRSQKCIQPAGTCAGVTEKVTFDGNFLRMEAMVDQRSASPRYITKNNVNWQGQGKVQTGDFPQPYVDLTLLPTPTLCTNSPNCEKPECRMDADCRIPFMENGDEAGETAGSLGTFWDDLDPPDETEAGTDVGGTPLTCVRPGGSSFGVCSHGLERQGLFTDNILLESGGVNADLYLMRMQRNHYENTAAQEGLDGDGVSYTWLLDNVVFNSNSSISLFNMKPSQYPNPADTKQTIRRGRGTAAEGNFIFKNGPQIWAQDTRVGKLYPGFGSGSNLGFDAVAVHGASGFAWDTRGTRVVGNTILDRPGAREWGTTAPVNIKNRPGSFIQANTVVADVKTGIFLNDSNDSSSARKTTGPVDSNLVLPTTRNTWADNICDTGAIGNDIGTASTGSQLVISDNASVRNLRTPRPPGYVCLDLQDRQRLFSEPLLFSPPVDLETYQRHLVRTQDDVWVQDRAWPSYDPALLDDVLRVRPELPACAFGARPACSDPDPDDDQYVGPGDNCPAIPNASQANADLDALGDVCDPTADATTQATGIGAVISGGIGDLNGSLSADDTYERISEGLDPACTRQCANKMSKVWTFPGLEVGQNYQLRVEGYRSGSSSSDNFTFSYSTRASGSCTSSEGVGPALVQISNLTDTDTVQSGSLGTLGAPVVCIRVQDSLQSKDTSAESLFLDRLYLQKTSLVGSTAAAADVSTSPGTKVGTFADTAAADESPLLVEQLTEQSVKVGNKFYSRLTHTWRFDGVPAAQSFTLRIEAQRNSGADDGFVFSFSTDGTNFTAINGSTITQAGSDQILEPGFGGASSMSRMIWIRVEDTVRNNTNLLLDSLLVDHLAIRAWN